MCSPTSRSVTIGTRSTRPVESRILWKDATRSSRNLRDMASMLVQRRCDTRRSERSAFSGTSPRKDHLRSAVSDSFTADDLPQERNLGGRWRQRCAHRPLDEHALLQWLHAPNSAERHRTQRRDRLLLPEPSAVVQNQESEYRIIPQGWPPHGNRARRKLSY